MAAISISILAITSTLVDHNLANGQFILISREGYQKIGGHESVRSDLLDDIGMARALAQADVPYHCLHLHHLFHCRMYTSFSEIWEGWTKNLFAGLRYSWKNLILAVVFSFCFSSLGFVLLLLAVLKLLSTTWSPSARQRG